MQQKAKQQHMAEHVDFGPHVLAFVTFLCWYCVVFYLESKGFLTRVASRQRDLYYTHFLIFAESALAEPGPERQTRLSL